MATTAPSPALTVIEGLFQSAIWNPLFSAMSVDLFSDLPWLNIWPIQPVANFLLGQVQTRLLGMLLKFVDMTSIPLINSAHQAAFNAAATKLQVVAVEFGANTPEFQSANQAEIASLLTFVTINA